MQIEFVYKEECSIEENLIRMIICKHPEEIQIGEIREILRSAIRTLDRTALRINPDSKEAELI